MAKPSFIVVSPRCMDAPGYEEWKAKAEAAGFLVLLGPETDQFLLVSDRCMQFRGDWSVWWLDPGRLKDFKPYYEHQEDCPEAKDRPE